MYAYVYVGFYVYLTITFYFVYEKNQTFLTFLCSFVQPQNFTKQNFF